MLYSIITFILATLFAKEFIVVNDNLVIIVVFAVIFLYLISVATPILQSHLSDVRSNMINEFAANVQNNIVNTQSYFLTIKVFLEYMYHIEQYLDVHFEELLTCEDYYN